MLANPRSLAPARPIVPGRFSHLDAYGVSLGQGAYARPRGMDDLYYGHNSRLSAMLGLTDPGETNPVSALATPYRNRSSGGANIIWHDDGCSYARFIQDHQESTGTKDQEDSMEAWPDGQRRLITINTGPADLFSVAMGGDNNDPRVTIPKVAMAVAVMISRARTAFIKEAPDVIGDFTRFDGAIYGNSGSAIYAATVEGQTCEYHFDPLPAGSAVALGGVHSNAWWSDWLVNGEPVLPSTFRPTQANRISGWIHRFVVGDTLPADEPITLEIEANDLSTFGVIDYCQVESPYRDRQPILIHDSPKWHTNSTAYWGANLADRDAVFDELNAAQEATVELFAYEGMNDVLYIPIDANFDKAEEYFRPTFYGYDGVHWSDAGHQLVADLDYDAIAEFVRRRGRA